MLPWRQWPGSKALTETKSKSEGTRFSLSTSLFSHHQHIFSPLYFLQDFTLFLHLFCVPLISHVYIHNQHLFFFFKFASLFRFLTSAFVIPYFLSSSADNLPRSHELCKGSRTVEWIAIFCYLLMVFVLKRVIYIQCITMTVSNRISPSFVIIK